MIPSPTPKDDELRVAALRRYCVLDTLAEPAFDRLTKIAQHIFGMPTVLISLIDSDRQWFKSRIGLEIEQTPRNISFCGHAVYHRKLLIVPDALADPRFFDNPFVVGPPGIRFYIGAPLITPDGFALGSLCVIDYVAHDEPDTTKIEALHNLAEAAVDALELRSRLTERERVENLKNEFVSTVSHELRTPLTAIAGMLEFLDAEVAGPLPEQAKEMVNVAYNNSLRLIRLINDILDIEKIESGRMPFDLAPLALKPLLERAVSEMRSFAEGLGVRVEIEAAPGGAYALVDSDRLIQVLTNLISNAAKFSPREGVVTVALGKINDQWRIAVTDRGPGIPESFRRRVFEKFAQADGTDSRRGPGTGLGLAIVKKIVEQLDGTVSFDTRAGCGTTFHVDLPRWKAINVAGISASAQAVIPSAETQ
jgi:signal transduction histidine kinase